MRYGLIVGATDSLSIWVSVYLQTWQKQPSSVMQELGTSLKEIPNHSLHTIDQDCSLMSGKEMVPGRHAMIYMDDVYVE